jgi:hypothetical protein
MGCTGVVHHRAKRMGKGTRNRVVLEFSRLLRIQAWDAVTSSIAVI